MRFLISWISSSSGKSNSLSPKFVSLKILKALKISSLSKKLFSTSSKHSKNLSILSISTAISFKVSKPIIEKFKSFSSFNLKQYFLQSEYIFESSRFLGLFSFEIDFQSTFAFRNSLSNKQPRNPAASISSIALPNLSSPISNTFSKLIFWDFNFSESW